MFSKFSTLIQHAVDALSTSETGIDDFQSNWKQITQFFINAKDYKLSIYQTTLPELIDKLLDQLLDEEMNNESGVAGPCLEYVLQHRILETLYTLARTDCPPGMKQVVLQTFSNLLSKIRHPILPHVNVHRPIQKLVRICGEVRAGPAEIEEVQFLLVLCAKIKSDPHLVNFFIENVKTPQIAIDQRRKDVIVQNKRFLLIDSLLLLANSEDARVAVKACEGLLLLASLPDNHAAQTIIDTTKFIDHLSHKLVHLHARLPKVMPSNEVMHIDVKWGLDRTSYMEDGVQSFEGRRGLIALLSWLDFCDQLLTCAHPLICEPLCATIQSLFLRASLQPLIMQTSEAVAISTTACLTSCLKVVSSVPLHDAFVQFIIGNEENLLRNRLIERCMHVSEELCVTTWRLFEVLTSRPHHLTLQYLLLHNSPELTVIENNDEDEISKEENNKDDICCKEVDIQEIVDIFLHLIPQDCLTEKIEEEDDQTVSETPGYDSYLREATQKYLPFRQMSKDLKMVRVCPASEPAKQSFVHTIISRLSTMLNQSYELNLRVTSVISQLCLIPHSASCLLLFRNDESKLNILFTLQQLVLIFDERVKSMDNFAQLISNYKRKLLSPSPSISRGCVDEFLSGVIILAEFCQELAAIFFVKHCY